MRKATLVKLFCLVVACMLIIPMVIACGDNTPELPGGSTNSGTESSNGGNNGGNTGDSDHNDESGFNEGRPI